MNRHERRREAAQTRNMRKRNKRSDLSVGNPIRKMLALSAVPMILAGVLAYAYWPGNNTMVAYNPDWPTGNHGVTYLAADSAPAALSHEQLFQPVSLLTSDGTPQIARVMLMTDTTCSLPAGVTQAMLRWPTFPDPRELGLGNVRGVVIDLDSGRVVRFGDDARWPTI